MAKRQRKLPEGHNGGPPLDDGEHIPVWGAGGFKTFFWWKKAHARAWRKSHAVMVFRDDKAEKIGLSYEEYSLEIMERGRYLSADDDAARIAAIKTGRRRRRDKGHV